MVGVEVGWQVRKGGLDDVYILLSAEPLGE